MSLYKKGHSNRYTAHPKLSTVSPAKPAETERIATTKNAAGSTVACLMTARTVTAVRGSCRDTSQLGPTPAATAY